VSEFKGTPGPWHRDYAGNGNVWATNCKVADTANPVQEWRYRDVAYAERAANANLIAAAPDLLKVVENFINALDGGDVDYNYLAANARAAIAKALQP